MAICRCRSSRSRARCSFPSSSPVPAKSRVSRPRQRLRQERALSEPLGERQRPGCVGLGASEMAHGPKTLREPELDRRIDSRTVTNVLERLPEEQHRLREAVLVVADLAQQA
jgi:hypothetical protein